MSKQFSIRFLLALAAITVLIGVGCGGNKSQAVIPSGPRAVTAEIKAGIEKHIEQEAARNDGFFKLTFDERELQLKLVKVHVEYLASLGPEYNFACVDLAGTDGEVYDVDFFLKGPPDNMTVTETTVHKINGQPLYAWEQKKDKTWVRVEVDEAANALFGVIEGPDQFEFRYDTKVPAIKGKGRMWIPLPTSDEFQTVKITSIKAPGKQTTLEEKKYGNKVLFLELTSEDSGKPIEIRIQAKRLEKGPYEAPVPKKGEYLNPNRLVPLTENFAAIATEVLKDKKGELVRARALYDHVIDRMAYKKVGKGWGQGDANFACDSRIGNCTDYHSYFIALARSAGIPARFAIGAAVPSSRDDGGISGYHCWAEFYAEGKWWPVDISEGDKYSNLATYYFGHHPGNRIEFSKGRDLEVDPAPKSGPINFFAYPVVEIDGQNVKLKPKFSFKRSS